jgi:rubrerythrin
MSLSPWQSVDDILDFAIQVEHDSIEAYGRAVEMTQDPENADLLRTFMKQERAHEVRLKELRGAQGLEPTLGDLSALHNQVNPNPPDVPTDSFIAIVRYAVKAEADTEVLYRTLAEMSSDPDIRVMFEALAQEERDHATWFAAEYKRQAGDAPTT